MTPENFNRIIMPAAFELLPETLFGKKLDLPMARVIMLTIGMQESDFDHRRQINGPARGFFQFEKIGVLGLWDHHRVGELVRDTCGLMGYYDIKKVYNALEHNDVLAAALARLLLYTYPGRLPHPEHYENGWNQYIAQWRPGKPKPERWNERWHRANQIIFSQ